MMDQLHDRGVRLSMDDFGTGYSSLSYLKRFQIYKLKIDQSFVRDLDDDTNDRAIVSAIIRMAQALGMQTTAEGVETDGQLEFLREQGCDEGQGYLFSRPLPAAAFEAYLREHLNGETHHRAPPGG
ncbi:Phytochrome-like protein cph2 [compost metagenome]